MATPYNNFQRHYYYIMAKFCSTFGLEFKSTLKVNYILEAKDYINIFIKTLLDLNYICNLKKPSS